MRGFFWEDFFEITENKGAELLYDDKKWIRETCKGYPRAKLQALLDRYIELWLISMSAESLEHKKQNVGRFAANTFLRESIENLHKQRS